MDYFTQSFTNHQSKHASALNSSGVQAYVIPTLLPPMMTMAQPIKSIEAKPRLGKDEVNILEQEFRKNPKPSTLTKKAFAEEMNVDLPRINNWFQNRRAKRKQENKLKENEAAQINLTSIYSSPSFSNVKPQNSDNNQIIIEKLFSVDRQQSANTSTSPELTNVSSTRNSFPSSATAPQNNSHMSHDPYLLQNSIDCDRASTLTSGNPVTARYLADLPFECSKTENGNMNLSTQLSPSSVSKQISAGSSPNGIYSYGDTSLHPFNSMPPQLIQGSEPLMLLSPQSSSGQAKEDSYHEDLAENDLLVGHTELDFSSNADECRVPGYESDYHSEPLGPPPGPSNIPFRSRPPMNIALRRKKVRHRPAALISGTLGFQHSVGPCTTSQIEGFNLPSKSPIDLPIRKIVSAGGNRVVVSGRVQKSGFDIAQRSPHNFGSFENVGTFMEHNFHNMYNAPPLTGLSSLCSSLSPSTPNDLNFTQPDGAGSATSTGDGNYVFNLNVSNCFIPVDQSSPNFTSSEITPSIPHIQNSLSPWSNGLDYNEKIRLFDTTDEAQSSGIPDTFNFDPQLSNSFALNISSQPSSPVFSSEYDSCMSNYLSPHNEASNTANQYGIEYTFTNPNFESGKSLQKNKNKEIQFSHTTSADFSVK